ncbi:hypothetical protein K8R66_01555 [bacterium]|nr:hypothetical protein [bacterium]
MKSINKILDYFNKDKKYAHFFVYKWGILAGVVESLLAILFTFSLINLYEVFSSLGIFVNTKSILIITVFSNIIFFIFTFLIIFGMPIYLLFKKRMIQLALLVLLTTIITLFIFFVLLFAILFI